MALLHIFHFNVVRRMMSQVWVRNPWSLSLILRSFTQSSSIVIHPFKNVNWLLCASHGTYSCAIKLGGTNIWNLVLFSFTPFPLGHHTLTHSVRPNISAISFVKLEVTNPLAIFIVIVCYASWFTSLSGWIPLGEILCHFNLPLMSSPVLPPLNSHTCVYSKGYRPHKLSAHIPAFCGECPGPGLYFVIPCCQWYLLSFFFFLTILQVCFALFLFQISSHVSPPSLSYFDREAYTEGPRDWLYLHPASPQ